MMDGCAFPSPPIPVLRHSPDRAIPRLNTQLLSGPAANSRIVGISEKCLDALSKRGSRSATGRSVYSSGSIQATIDQSARRVVLFLLRIRTTPPLASFCHETAETSVVAGYWAG